VPQIVHRPTVFDDEKRYPFRIVFCDEYPYPKNQGNRFDDPKNLVKDLFMAGYGFIVGDVLEEFPHDLIFAVLVFSARAGRFVLESPLRSLPEAAIASPAIGPWLDRAPAAPVRYNRMN
jgi:hypothetical protein